MPVTAIIIDDERLARNELKKLLEQHPEIQITHLKYFVCHYSMAGLYR